MTTPSPMTCREVFERLESFVDRELTEDEMHLVHDHLERCTGCAGDYQLEATALEALRVRLRRVAIPSDLRERVLANLARAGRADSTPPGTP